MTSPTTLYIATLSPRMFITWGTATTPRRCCWTIGSGHRSRPATCVQSYGRLHSSRARGTDGALSVSRARAAVGVIWDQWNASRKGFALWAE
jgi:hypothetical protein